MKKFICAVLMGGILLTGCSSVKAVSQFEMEPPKHFEEMIRFEAAKTIDMGITFKQFADNFADTLDSIGNYSQYYIFNATLKKGSVKDVYQYNFHSNLSMLATISHSTGNVIEVSFIASPQNETHIVEMITLYGILMKTLNQGLSDYQMNQLLKQVYCHPENISELIKNNGKAIQGNIKYTTFFIENNGLFMLNASPKDF